jgi:hypothetical protein
MEKVYTYYCGLLVCGSHMEKYSDGLHQLVYARQLETNAVNETAR